MYNRPWKILPALAGASFLLLPSMALAKQTPRGSTCSSIRAEVIPVCKQRDNPAFCRGVVNAAWSECKRTGVWNSRLYYKTGVLTD
jgi:hypothetical protein